MKHSYFFAMASVPALILCSCSQSASSLVEEYGAKSEELAQLMQSIDNRDLAAHEDEVSALLMELVEVAAAIPEKMSELPEEEKTALTTQYRHHMLSVAVAVGGRPYTQPQTRHAILELSRTNFLLSLREQTYLMNKITPLANRVNRSNLKTYEDELCSLLEQYAELFTYFVENYGDMPIEDYTNSESSLVFGEYMRSMMPFTEATSMLCMGRPSEMTVFSSFYNTMLDDSPRLKAVLMKINPIFARMVND